MRRNKLETLSHFYARLKSEPIEIILFLCASFSIVILFLMVLFVTREGAFAFSMFGTDLVFGQIWDVKRDLFGGLPLLYGSLMVTSGALAISIPLGVLTAIFIAEILPFSLKDPVKSIVELLASIPSVIYGFIGLISVAPLVASSLGLASGRCALTASLILAIMTIPTIVSVAGETIAAVPKDYKEAALALGATRLQTIRGVVLPIAKSGILASVMLGFGRAIGETIAVSMVAGNRPWVPNPPWNFSEAVYTIPAFIAARMGGAAFGSVGYSALFGLALILLIITFIVNTVADAIVKRGVQL